MRRSLLPLALTAFACGSEVIPAEPAPGEDPPAEGGKADSAVPGTPLYRISLVALDPIQPPYNWTDFRQTAGKACSDWTPQLRADGLCACDRPYDRDHATLGVAVSRGGRLVGAPRAFDDGLENYFAHVYDAGNDPSAPRFVSQRTDDTTPPLGCFRANPFANPRAPTPMVLDEVAVPHSADARLAIAVLADSRSDPAVRSELRSAGDEQRCHVKQIAERGALGQPFETLPPHRDPTPGCGPAWTYPPPGIPHSSPRLRGRDIDFGCEGYVANPEPVVLSGDRLAELTDNPAGAYDVPPLSGLQQATACWYWASLQQKAFRSATTERRVRLRIERVGEVPYPPFEPLPAGECTLRPIATGPNTALVRTWGDSGSTWQDQLGAIIERARGTTIATLLRLRGQTRETGPAGVTRDGYGAAIGRDLPAFRRSSCLASPALCLVGGAPPKPVHPRCTRFANVTCPARGPLGLRFLGCYIDNGGATDRALTLDVAPDLALSLYGEFAGDGTLLEHRLRYQRSSPDGTTIDHMLRRSTEPPR